MFDAGTKEERGLIAWAKEMQLTADETTSGDIDRPSTYDFPYGMGLLRR